MKTTAYFLAFYAAVGIFAILPASYSQAAGENQDPYTFDEVNPLYYNTDPAKLIRIKTDSDVAAIRRALVNYIWPSGDFPSSRMPDKVEKDITDQRYDNLREGNLARIDRITTLTDPGLDSVSYHFVPKQANGRLVIYQQGHDGDFVKGIDTIKAFVDKGYAVMGFAMPLIGMNNQPTVYLERFGYFKLEKHMHMGLLDEPIRPFIEPVVVGVNYALANDYDKVHMIGYSGGGWTTTVCAAVDDRISYSYPIAGSCPIYLKSHNKRDWGDYEQIVRDLYKTCNYLEMYILGATGAGRRQMQVINRYDSCCYAGVKYRAYEKTVSDMAAAIGGSFEVFCDESHREHKISTVALKAVLDDMEPCAAVSPDGRLAVKVTSKKLDTLFPGQQRLFWRAELDGKVVLTYAPLGAVMEGAGGDFVTDLTLSGKSDRVIKEDYLMPVGKKSRRTSCANQTTLVYTNPSGQVMELVLRAYDDAVAWRYNFPGDGPAKILSEASAFRFPPGTMAWLQPYKDNYEDFYDRDGRGDPAQYGLPGLFRTPAGIWVLVTEAAVYGDYSGGRLNGTLDGKGMLELNPEGHPSSHLPWSTPWRVAILGDALGTIVESVVVDNLNPPCEAGDTAWIRPGRATFPWWSDFKVNANYPRLKEFVDFAAGMGWEWIEFDTALIEGDNDGTDTWMTAPWVPELIKYARSKNVKVFGWENWKNLDTPEKREKIFGLFNKFGIDGIKIDFLDSDAQERFQFRDDAVRDCLKHKLMVSFHGATIPRGQQRRWPHIATWEAVHGAEWYRLGFGTPNPPAHNCILPFTRNVVGSMDYTPVTFSAEKKTTTDAHELALSVIFESGWQCLADSPESYAANAGTPFLRQVHAAWDDIHFIDGYPGEFVCLARRKGKDWFVAGINAGAARTLTIPLDFIGSGTYTVELYRDGDEGKITVDNRTIDTNEPLVIRMAEDGGFAVKFEED